MLPKQHKNVIPTYHLQWTPWEYNSGYIPLGCSHLVLGMAKKKKIMTTPPQGGIKLLYNNEVWIELDLLPTCRQKDEHIPPPQLCMQTVSEYVN